MSAPLLGSNLVRLLYLDEAGTDRKSPSMCVAGVLVHGDKQWPEVDRRILALIEKYIPEQDRQNFVFHATDIFHGSKYFDRRKPEWSSQQSREAVLNDLTLIIAELGLPVVAGLYTKEKFGDGAVQLEEGKIKDDMLHGSATADCLIRADKWLARYAPDELATVVHEDGTPSKSFIKRVIRILRDEDKINENGLGAEKESIGIPLRHIIDTVHFAEKPDARPLQLADLCAFIFGRAIKQMSVPTYAYFILKRHLELTVQPEIIFAKMDGPVA